jgi:hypothetical protein
MSDIKEKNNDRYSDRWPFLFNDVINSFGLQEIELYGHQFKYPLMSVRVLERGVSDHTPLLLDTGNATFTGNTRQFKMELSWFMCEDFYNQVAEIWNKPVRGRNLVQR